MSTKNLENQSINNARLPLIIYCTRNPTFNTTSVHHFLPITNLLLPSGTSKESTMIILILIPELKFYKLLRTILISLIRN